MKNEIFVHRHSATAQLPSLYGGDFQVIAYTNKDIDEHTHLAILKGEISPDEADFLVRVHSECLTGDGF